MHRRRNDLWSGGGQIFGSLEWRVSTGCRACVTQGGVWGGMCPLRSWNFFENVGSNEAIWCTIFHHIKHLTACLLRCFFFLTLEQDGQKSGGAMPPSLKSGGATGPPPGSAAYGLMLCICRTSFSQLYEGSSLFNEGSSLFNESRYFPSIPYW